MEELLKQFKEFQDFAATRGLAYIYAAGAKWVFYSTPEKFEVTDEGVEMTFEENTRHDSPDRESITLTLKDLEMSAEEWEAHIEEVKDNAIKKARKRQEEIKEGERQDKEKQLKKLKEELGHD